MYGTCSSVKMIIMTSQFSKLTISCVIQNCFSCLTRFMIPNISAISNLHPQSLGSFVLGFSQFQENDYGVPATVNLYASVAQSVSIYTD